MFWFHQKSFTTICELSWMPTTQSILSSRLRSVPPCRLRPPVLSDHICLAHWVVVIYRFYCIVLYCMPDVLYSFCVFLDLFGGWLYITLLPLALVLLLRVQVSHKGDRILVSLGKPLSFLWFISPFSERVNVSNFPIILLNANSSPMCLLRLLTFISEAISYTLFSTYKGLCFITVEISTGVSHNITCVY